MLGLLVLNAKMSDKKTTFGVGCVLVGPDWTRLAPPHNTAL